MRPPTVAIVGPTASGKSSVAMAVADESGDVELVSIDSMQVYRRMDVGTAGPTPGERARVRHHLIDLVEPSDEFSVADFKRAYDDALTDIASRDRRALLVGGTGLYHRAVVDDLDLPGQFPKIRRRLERELATVGPEELHRRVSAHDPVAGSRIEPTNGRRAVRALEVIEGSGRTFSSFGPGLDTYPPSHVSQIGLRWDRAVLAERIEARVHLMMADGLVDEVEAVLASGGFSRTAGQALGYREIAAHLAGAAGFDEAVEQVVVRTRQFAVRQLRWFQRDPRVIWVDVDSDAVAEAAPIVIDALRSAQVSRAPSSGVRA